VRFGFHPDRFRAPSGATPDESLGFLSFVIREQLAGPSEFQDYSP
jgi:hypothetical protein